MFTNRNLSIIYDNVTLMDNVEIGSFSIIGHPLSDDTLLQTMIGRGAKVRSHTVIYTGNTIGNMFQTGHHVLIRESNTIGNNVSIGSHSVIEHHITIEDGVRIHSQAFVPEFSILKSNCWIGPGVTLTNAKYPRSLNVKKDLIGPTIFENAIIGARSVILPGIVIGKFALVGSGAVATKDVPDYAIVVGNPAKVIGDVRAMAEYKTIIPLQ